MWEERWRDSRTLYMLAYGSWVLLTIFEYLGAFLNFGFGFAVQ